MLMRSGWLAWAAAVAGTDGAFLGTPSAGHTAALAVTDNKVRLSTGCSYIRLCLWRVQTELQRQQRVGTLYLLENLLLLVWEPLLWLLLRNERIVLLIGMHLAGKRDLSLVAETELGCWALGSTVPGSQTLRKTTNTGRLPATSQVL